MASLLKYVLVKWTSGKDYADMTVIEFDWVRGGENLDLTGTEERPFPTTKPNAMLWLNGGLYEIKSKARSCTLP